jgi:hypothetical protein
MKGGIVRIAEATKLVHAITRGSRRTTSIEQAFKRGA